MQNKKLLIATSCLTLQLLVLSGCASSIVDGEGVRTSSTVLEPKPKDSPIDVFFSGNAPSRPGMEVGRVSARAWVLEKGVEELRSNARKLGADAVVNVEYDRRFSADFLQNLYFIDGGAIVWK